jgi:hypothetical protein
VYQHGYALREKDLHLSSRVNTEGPGGEILCDYENRGTYRGSDPATIVNTRNIAICFSKTLLWNFQKEEHVAEVGDRILVH